MGGLNFVTLVETMHLFCCIGDKDKMNNFLIVTGITLHTVIIPDV